MSDASDSPKEASLDPENQVSAQHQDVNKAVLKDSPDAHILEADQLGFGAAELQKAPDGHTVLIPQPTSDPNDPLNWPARKKNVVLAVISFLAFLPDYGSAIGAVTLIPQAEQWQLPQNTVQRNLVGNLFCLGAGALFTVALSTYFGRLPVLLYFHLLAFGTGIWCAAAESFNSFLAARIINGFFGTVAQAGGLMWIKDMYFFHEHPRMINWWSGAIILAPYLGPFTAAFVVWKLSWTWAYWIYSILNGIGLLLVIFLTDESYYKRSLPPQAQPAWRSRWLRLVGIEKHPRTSVLHAVARPAIAFSKVPVMLVTVYYFLNFSWIIGVNATISTWMTNFYGFDFKALGLFYFFGIAGSIIGQAVGHWLFDAFGAFYAKRHGGRIDPEARLVISYLASALMAAGLLLLGFALENIWHYAAVAVVAAVQVVGIMIATTAVNAYLLDSYPEGSGEVGAWIVVGRTLGGFMATYIEIPWVLKDGTVVALGSQAGITTAAALIPLFLQTYGKKIRQRQGRMRFPGGE